MTIFVFSIILFAAALHASWNAVVKSGTDKLLTTVLVTTVAALIAAIVLPFLHRPAKESWFFIGASIPIHILYFALVAKTYHSADMGQTYPLMRGSAPLIVAVTGALFFGTVLMPTAWVGIAIICAGIISMAVFTGKQNNNGAILALLNAAVIASYTLVDGEGVRLSGSPVAYTLWVFMLTGISLLAWMIFKRGAEIKCYFTSNWQLGIAGGFGTVISYGLILWAMTVAPIAVVAALRETSILFGIVLSAVALNESISPLRISAACIIAIGAGILRFS